MSPEIWQSAGVVPVWCECPCILKGGGVQGPVWGLPKQSDSWFNHTGCLRNQDRDTGKARDMDKWVVWFYVEPFTLHLNSDGADTIVPIILVRVPVPVPVPDTTSVITPLQTRLKNITFPQLRCQAVKTYERVVNRGVYCERT